MDDISQKIEGVGWGIIKWFLGIGISLTIFSGIIWIIFYSTYFANLSFIIPTRIWYQNTIWQTEGIFFHKIRFYPPFDPVYTIQTTDSRNGVYNYTFLGKFTKIDVPSNTIYLKGLDGKTYGFLFGDNLGQINNGKPDFAAQIIQDGGYQKPSKTFKSVMINVSNRPYTENSIIQIIWDDKRLLNQVTNDYNLDPSAPLNQNSSIFIMTKYD